MKIDIITLFPEMFLNVFEFGIPAQAKKSGLLEINILNLRDFANNQDGYRQVDDRPFGGGTGMVLMPEPLARAIESVRTENSMVINLSPQGQTLNQGLAENLSITEHLIIICGRYEGIDERIIEQYVDIEISIGDYVLSGGEFASMVVIDTITRLIPGAIKNQNFNESESFSIKTDRSLLDYPVYTRPADFNGHKVPDVLLSGDHQKVKDWEEQNRKIKK